MPHYSLCFHIILLERGLLPSKLSEAREMAFIPCLLLTLPVSSRPQCYFPLKNNEAMDNLMVTDPRESLLWLEFV